MAHKYDAITPNLKSKMERIVYSLEPENLSCDGELSRAEMEGRRNQLSKEWWILVDEAKATCKINVEYGRFQDYIM